MTTYAHFESAALTAEIQQRWVDAADLWVKAAAVAAGERTRNRAKLFAEEALANAQRLGQIDKVSA